MFYLEYSDHYREPSLSIAQWSVYCPIMYVLRLILVLSSACAGGLVDILDADTFEDPGSLASRIGSDSPWSMQKRSI